MIVIIPHPTEELILIREQKKMISYLFEKGKIIYAHMPLWIPTDFETLEQAKNEITGITINTPQFDEEQKCIECPVEIKTKDSKRQCSLPYIHLEQLPANFYTFKDAVKKTFPLTLKIFRLGECSVNENIYTLSNTSWKKF